MPSSQTPPAVHSALTQTEPFSSTTSALLTPPQHHQHQQQQQQQLQQQRPSSSKTENALLNPGTIQINVQGAFIVDDDEEEPQSSTTATTTPTLVDSASSSPSSSTQDEKKDADLDDDEFDYKHETSDIRLPNHTTVVSHVAVDIGGSLAKLVYFSTESGSTELGGRLNFLHFETADRIDECIDLMRKLQQKHRKLNGSINSELRVVATGGGAFKYYDEIKKRLGVEVLREDEMECLIVGLDFFIQEIPREVFTHDPAQPTSFLPPRTAIYPYLLVNIGSGVSMIKVTSPSEFTRVGGTSLGGGTLWGLLSLITGARNFDDMLALADKGDNTAVDMLVGDIYGAGTGYSKIGLKSTTIASSFGKVYKMKREAEQEAEDGGWLASEDREEGQGVTFRPEDVSRSLLYAVSYNIGQIAYLQSTVHNLPHIYFGGSFIRGHHQTMDTLSYAITYWSGGKKQAYFLRHEGYLGAVGAFLKRQPRNWGRRNSLDGLAQRFAAQSHEAAGESGVETNS